VRELVHGDGHDIEGREADRQQVPAHDSSDAASSAAVDMLW
jgi:hypothetical protein